MISAVKDTQDALASNDLEDVKIAEAQSYLFSGFIIVLESVKKGWDAHQDTLKNPYAYIFKFCEFVRTVCTYVNSIFGLNFFISGTLPLPFMSTGECRGVKNVDLRGSC